MVGSEDVVIQLQVKDWKGLASFGDFCITATFQSSSQETRRCLEARRSGRLPLLFIWKQGRQRLPRARSAHVRLEVAAESSTGPRLAFLHISLREAQDMLANPLKPESHSWRPLVGGGRGAQLLVGAFFRPAASCDLQPPATAPHSPAEPQRTPAHSRPHSGKSAADFVWDPDNQLFRMEPPATTDELYRFAARVREARDLDLLVLGHQGRGGGGGLRLEVALGGFPALTAGALPNALAAPSADDRSALCFRGSVDAFRQAACAEPACLRLVDGRGNCIGHASFPLGTLLSGQLFNDFSAGDGACNLFEAEHELTMACDERGAVPRGADGSVPTVVVLASLRRVPSSEWQRRGQLATSVVCPAQPEGAGRRSSSSASPAHYSPASTSRSLGVPTLCCDEESAGEAADRLARLAVSATGKPDSVSRSFPSLPTGDSVDHSTDHCPSYSGIPAQRSSVEEIPGEHSSRSSVSQDKSRSFPDIVPDEPAPPSTTTLATGGDGPTATCLTGNMHSPSGSDSETRFILEHIPRLELGEGVSKGTLSVHSGSLSSLLDLSPVSCQIPKCERKLPVNRIRTANLRRISVKNSSDTESMPSPLINSYEAAEKETASTLPCLVLETDSVVSDSETAKDTHGKKLDRANSDVVQSRYSADKQVSPLLSDGESVTSLEMDRPSPTADDPLRCHSPIPLSKSPSGSQYWAIKRKKHDRRKKSSDRSTMKSVTQDKSLTNGRCNFDNQLDTSGKRDSDEVAKNAEKKSSLLPSPREELDYTEKLTARYHKCKGSHLMYRARYIVTKILVFDESLCGVLFVGFQHHQLEEKNVLTKVVIKDPNETVVPSGVAGTVKICSLRGHVLEQVAALPPTLNVSHHKVRCDPHLVQAELSFAVAEPGMFALYRVATGEVVGTVHVDLRILGPYRCPFSVCTKMGTTCRPYTDDEITEDETQSLGEHEIRGNRSRSSLPESEREKTGKDAWREREMEVLATIDDMYADVCQMTEETKILQGRAEWLDPNVRRVWMWRLESLEARYERACQKYREHYGIRD